MVCGSDGKESPCNAGDLSLIPGWGRSPGKRNGYPLQCSCLEKSMEEEPGWLQSMGSQRVRHDWATNTISDGPVVKNPPCNSGDVGSIPGWGTKIPHPTEQLSPHAATMMPVGSKTHHEDPAHQKKKGGEEITVSKLLKIKPNEDWPLILNMTLITFAITDSKGAFITRYICMCVRACVRTFSSLPLICLSIWNYVTTETFIADETSTMPAPTFSSKISLLFFRILDWNFTKFLPLPMHWKFFYILFA